MNKQLLMNMKEVANDLQNDRKWAKLLMPFMVDDVIMVGTNEPIFRVENVRALIKAALIIGERKGILPIPFTKDDLGNQGGLGVYSND